MKVEFKSKPKRNIFFERGRNSVWGFISIGIFIVSLVIILISIDISHSNSGNAGYIVGSLGLTSLFSGISGVFIGIRGFKDEDKMYWPIYAGCIGNAIIVVFIISLYIIGYK